MTQLILKGKFFNVVHIRSSDMCEGDNAKGNAEEELKHKFDDFNKYQIKVC
jgi:hypothetical protein